MNSTRQTHGEDSLKRQNLLCGMKQDTVKPWAFSHVYESEKHYTAACRWPCKQTMWLVSHTLDPESSALFGLFPKSGNILFGTMRVLSIGFARPIQTFILHISSKPFQRRPNISPTSPPPTQIHPALEQKVLCYDTIANRGSHDIAQ